VEQGRPLSGQIMAVWGSLKTGTKFRTVTLSVHAP
jgi:hypothetical protein